jgi:hypothetical protein
VKYLGFMLDGSLSGQDHALGVIKKMASRLSFLYRNAALLDLRSRKTLCLSLIQPYFDYCSNSRYNGLSAKLRGRLDVLQRRIIRYIYDLGPRSHIGSEHLKQLQGVSSGRRRMISL